MAAVPYPNQSHTVSSSSNAYSPKARFSGKCIALHEGLLYLERDVGSPVKTALCKRYEPSLIYNQSVFILDDKSGVRGGGGPVSNFSSESGYRNLKFCGLPQWL
jgi:hypothetical protein